MRAVLRFGVLVVLSLLMVSELAVAQDSAGDPPSRVARLQYMEGQVSLQPGGVDEWVAANQNRPLTTADRIWTDRDSKAELSLASTALRMGSETSVTITNLNDNTAQIEVDQGRLELSVRYLNDGEVVEVDTPNFAFTVNRPGEYRFDVPADQDQSFVTVRHGDGEAFGQNNSMRLISGESFGFSQGQSLTYASQAFPERDGFDQWCEWRERRETSSPSARYLAAGTVGYEDLDDNGDWQQSPIYGAIWYPRVDPGWAPYRYGHWAWVEPWGWTWVDDAPWGFAPFHYGRWVQVGYRWGWVPGPVGVRPVYAPALVGWVGGPGFGVSLGIGGGVGWFPLGWHDPYLPAYPVSAAYARNVNISNSRVVNVTVVNNYYTTTNVTVRNTTINNIRYENATVHGAVTGVSGSAFAAGKPVQGNSVVVPANAVGHASMMTSAAVVPTKAAVLGGRPPANVPQHLVVPRAVAARTPPPPRPVSFEQQRPLLEKSGGVPLTPQVRSNLRQFAPPPATQGRAPVIAAKPAVNNAPAGYQNFGHSAPANVSPAAPNRPATNAPAPAVRENVPAPVTPNRPATPAVSNRENAPAPEAREYVPQPRNAAPPQRNAVAPPQPQHAAPAQTQAAPANRKATPPPAKTNKENDKDKKENKFR